MTDTTRLLVVEDLEVQYPVRTPEGRTVARAVDGVSLHVNRGETLALVGESGSGKTSTANAVMRLIEPTGGRILFEGRDLVPLSGRALRSLRPRFQMIFQDPFESLDPRRTVLDTVMEPLVVHAMGADRAEREAMA
ncbi:MAG: ATP-binding cassette domain-containing protein, partial [Actinobacteria bacterium]|nr:ATP-binding cassette domain-containing protein [Actinomycetota bacterium]